MTESPSDFGNGVRELTSEEFDLVSGGYNYADYLQDIRRNTANGHIDKVNSFALDFVKDHGSEIFWGAVWGAVFKKVPI